MKKVNLAEKFNLFHEQWSPKIVGEVNDTYVKLAKLQGEFVWHTHPEEDEMFLLIKGKLTLKLPQEDVHLEEGEFFIVPKGVEHLPVAEEEVQVMIIEPKDTLNTGDVHNERTVAELEKL